MPNNSPIKVGDRITLEDGEYEIRQIHHHPKTVRRAAFAIRANGLRCHWRKLHGVYVILKQLTETPPTGPAGWKPGVEGPVLWSKEKEEL